VYQRAAFRRVWAPGDETTSVVRVSSRSGGYAAVVAPIALRGLVKTYDGGVGAVRGVDLEVRDGELMVLIGPYGRGNSTILCMIAGLEEVTAGTVSIDT